MHLLICTTGMNFDTIKVLDRFKTPGKGITQRGCYVWYILSKHLDTTVMKRIQANFTSVSLQQIINEPHWYSSTSTWVESPCGVYAEHPEGSLSLTEILSNFTSLTLKNLRSKIEVVAGIRACRALLMDFWRTKKWILHDVMYKSTKS